MKPHLLTRVCRRLASGLAVAMLLAVTGLTMTTSSQAAELGLSGYRWEKPVVTYWVNTQGNISNGTLLDVQTAIDEWNVALSSVPEAPTLAVAKSSKSADVVITLRSRVRRGPDNFGGWTVPQVTDCSLESVAIEVVGLRPEIEDFRTRNLVRREIGKAMGLGSLWGCPPDGCLDIMDVTIDYWLGGDLQISDCDIAGIAAIYAAPSCDQIPESIPYTCD